MIPGEILTPSEEVILNDGRPSIEVTVANTGDRPIQVGSHYHFFEVNPALAFDRAISARERSFVHDLFARFGAGIVLPERQFDIFSATYSP